MARYDLSRYDGVLAFGKVLAEPYRSRGWIPRALVWHEAADVRRFRPLPAEEEGDLVHRVPRRATERVDELLAYAADLGAGG